MMNKILNYYETEDKNDPKLFSIYKFPLALLFKMAAPRQAPGNTKPSIAAENPPLNSKMGPRAACGGPQRHFSKQGMHNRVLFF